MAENGFHCFKLFHDHLGRLEVLCIAQVPPIRANENVSNIIVNGKRFAAPWRVRGLQRVGIKKLGKEDLQLGIPILGTLSTRPSSTLCEGLFFLGGGGDVSIRRIFLAFG